MRDNWLSNRVFKNYDDILDHCCLEQARLTAHHLHRDTKMGPWVLNRNPLMYRTTSNTECLIGLEWLNAAQVIP